MDAGYKGTKKIKGCGSLYPDAANTMDSTPDQPIHPEGARCCHKAIRYLLPTYSHVLSATSLVETPIT